MSTIISTMLIVLGGIIVQSTITTYHIYTTNQHDALKCNKIKTQPSLYGSFLLVFMGFVNLFTLLGINIAQLQPTTPSQCFINILIGVSVAIIFKVVLYSVLILRIYESYNNTIMGYSPKMLIAWIIILTIWSAFNIFLNFVFTKASVIYSVCSYEFNDLFMLSLAAMHFTGCVVNTYLFLKSTIKLNKHIKKNKNATNKDLKSIAIIQCILNAGAVSITLLAIILTAMFSYPEIWTTFDMNISTLCVILLYKGDSNFMETTCNVICCCCGLNLNRLESEIETITISTDGITGTTNTVTTNATSIDPTDKPSITEYTIQQANKSIKTQETDVTKSTQMTNSDAMSKERTLTV